MKGRKKKNHNEGQGAERILNVQRWNMQLLSEREKESECVSGSLYGARVSTPSDRQQHFGGI